MLGKKPRLLAALNLAAEKSDWGQPLRRASARRVACNRRSRLHRDGVEAEVDELGEVLLRRVTSVVDTGIASIPIPSRRSSRRLIFGLTAALYGEITIDKGRVQQSNFHDYRMLRIDQTPKIEVHIVKSGEPPAASARPAPMRARLRCATPSRR